MGIDYAIEKLSAGVDCLATGRGGIHERLFDAYLSAVMRLQSDDVPEDLRDRVDALHARLTSVSGAGGEGDIKATIGQMTEDEAVDAAQEIVELCWAVRFSREHEG